MSVTVAAQRRGRKRTVGRRGKMALLPPSLLLSWHSASSSGGGKVKDEAAGRLGVRVSGCFALAREADEKQRGEGSDLLL